MSDIVGGVRRYVLFTLASALVCGALLALDAGWAVFPAIGVLTSSFLFVPTIWGRPYPAIVSGAGAVAIPLAFTLAALGAPAWVPFLVLGAVVVALTLVESRAAPVDAVDSPPPQPET